MVDHKSAPGSEEPLAMPVENPPPGTSHLIQDRKVLRRYVLWFTLATAAFTTVWGSAASILLPNQIQILEVARFFTGADAGVDLQQLTALKAAVAAGTATATADQTRLLAVLANFEGSRAAGLAFVVSLGTVATLLAQPLVGVFSDRTKSRLGRRAPWMLLGAIVAMIAFVGLRFAPSVALVAIFWTIASVATNVAATPMIATVADRVPERKRGSVSSMGGLGNFLGGVFGAVVAGAAFITLGLNIWLIWGALVLAAVGLMIVRARDRSSTDLVVVPFSWRSFLGGFIVPLRSADFRWVWIARVLIVFGFTVSGALGLYMLQSYITPAMSVEEATATAPLLAIVGLPFTIVAVIFVGRLSDKVGRRKPFVIFASALMAASMAIPLIFPTLPGLLVQAVFASLAFGIFLPVDQALFIDVLPDMQSAGRDLGIANVATNLGQSLGPILAAQVVVITGGYQMVWVSALVLVAVAAFAIIPVKGAR